MAISDEELIKVQNLTDFLVVYTLPERNIKRSFAGQQVREIAAQELRELYMSPGGAELLRNYLSVKNKELALEFDIDEDVYNHEYNWTKEDIDKLLTSGSLDALKDALEFGPSGIVDSIINEAVTLAIPDNDKLKIIQEFTGRDVANMIQLAKALAEEKEEQPKTSSRRVADSNKTPETSKRRVSE